MDTPIVKNEATEDFLALPPPTKSGSALATAAAVIDLSTSDSDSDADGVGGGPKRSREVDGGGGRGKRARGPVADAVAAIVPAGFLDPLPPQPAAVAAPKVTSGGTKQFWKAGDYDGKPLSDGLMQPSGTGIEHVRVHPKFLHSNATSHKWALGALAELLDNSLDEVSNGATFVNIDMLENKKDETRMLLIEDDGGGMDPDKMRKCMSLGYSAKSKVASTIGQYGNGFKTSTMRIGADVLVFSRSRGKRGRSSTQTIGMLSYTFLRSTAKEDIIVPMVDYEKEQVWKRKVRTTVADWHTNLDTIIKWSPYSSEADLLQQFSTIKDQGTRIVIFNLWEDDQGELELDFDADIHDIQIRGVNRAEKNIEMAKQFPNSKHFLTYRHSLRSYASILYLRLPPFFRMILRGKEIEHHNIVNDMMLKQEVTYRPMSTDGLPKDSNMVAVVTIGFVKDAKHHIDVQGFNVYHKNRLIKPFWRVWTAAGSQGRGIIGVLEANFIEPAHDKQDFERTTILSRLEARLIQMQKTYWTTNCYRIGYVGQASKKNGETGDREGSPEDTSRPSSHRSGKDGAKSKDFPKLQSGDKSFSGSSNKNCKTRESSLESSKFGLPKSGQLPSRISSLHRAEKSEKSLRALRSRLHGSSDRSDNSDPEFVCTPSSRLISRSQKAQPSQKALHGESTSTPSPSSKSATGSERMKTRFQLKEGNEPNDENGGTIEDPDTLIKELKDENALLKEKLLRMESSMSQELQIERDKNKSLTERLEDLERQLQTANKEQEALIDIFSEERSRRDQEEENLRKKLKESSSTIQDLMEQLSAARNNRKL